MISKFLNWVLSNIGTLPNAQPVPVAPPASGFTLSTRSRNNLLGVHPDLVRVVELAVRRSKVDFIVTEGRRSVERQRQLVAEGKSQTMHSRHITGHAVDVVAWVKGQAVYNVEYMTLIAQGFKQAAAELRVPIEWGGDWKTFKDTPHFQLNKEHYP